MQHGDDPIRSNPPLGKLGVEYLNAGLRNELPDVGVLSFRHYSRSILL